MTRRWYRQRELTDVLRAAITSDGTAYVTTSYDGERPPPPPRRRVRRRRTTSTTSPARSPAAPPRYPEGECDLHRPLRRRRPRTRSSRTRLKRALERRGHPAARPARSCSTCRRRCAASPRADAITLRRARRRRLGARPRPAVRAPGDGRAAEPVAHVGVRARADPVARGRLPVPRRRPLEPEGRAAVRARRGPRAERRARRGGPRRLAARARARAGRGARVAAALPGPPLAARAPAVEPRAAERVAGHRPRARGGRRADRPLRPRDRGPRHRDRDHPGPHARPARRRRSTTASCACSRPPAAA